MNNIEVAARVAYETLRGYCVAIGESVPSWDDAPEWMRESARSGAALLLANPGLGPEALHDAWRAHKEADGWTWGQTKDAAARTHPCLSPRDLLHPKQQAKDEIFRAAVLAHLVVQIDPDAENPGTASEPTHKMLIHVPEKASAEYVERLRRMGSSWMGRAHMSALPGPGSQKGGNVSYSARVLRIARRGQFVLLRRRLGLGHNAKEIFGSAWRGSLRASLRNMERSAIAFGGTDLLLEVFRPDLQWN